MTSPKETINEEMAVLITAATKPNQKNAKGFTKGSGEYRGNLWSTLAARCY